jgi:hypothetical protein
MGHESIVAGFIEGFGVHNRSDLPDFIERNRAVLAALPPDDEWPFLVQSMFCVHRQYRADVIHFGTSYKAVEWDWAKWLTRFEDLLRRLYWRRASVTLLTELTVGDHNYFWTADRDAVEAAYAGTGDPQPITVWTFKGGPREFK